ncbi:hypothetical protein ZIOFF_053542 [Zingiber officinale]|uniref:ABC1 atypical kinase-like domain-containing protein n=1 Tax=Zingiber officinale TaxID=94328 RepID=A0A8J5KNL3_ZINOF|nr:hypothetical protein ZIOFF_053542 [Zingiber officinale]
MAAVLASCRCYQRQLESINQGRCLGDLSFSGSISNLKFAKFTTTINESSATKKLPRVLAKVQQEQADKFGTNGRPTKMVSNTNRRETKMVSTKNLVTHKDSSRQKSLSMHNSNVMVNGVSLIKRNSTATLSKTEKKDPKVIPDTDELKVLPSDEGFSWAKENYNSLQRTIDIWSFVVSFRLRVLFDNEKWAYFEGFTEEKQDRVPAFSHEKAKAFVQSELGCPIEVLFKEFEDRPIAAASLGQVHRAILHSGEQVVVKIQRPGLKKLFDIDLRNLKLVAEYFQRSETFGGPTRDWIGIYDECAKFAILNFRILYQEIDYINEGKNADRFCRDFRNIKWVRVPLIRWDYTTMKVLTMEYVPGTKINNLEQIDARGYSRSIIASRAIESYLIQILKTGFFHADPHPGNLAIDKDVSLIYYDFGMMGEIKSFTRKRLLDLFYSVYEKDANKVMKSLIDLEALQPTGDLSPVRRSIQFFLDNLLSQTPDQQQTLAAIGEDLFAIATDQPFRFPSTFTFVIRAFSTLEGIGYTLDPDFSFVKIAAPYAQELLDIRQEQRGGAELVQEIRKQANDARDSTISMPYRIQRIEDIVTQLESGDLKLRVRVLESERAARKASVLQMATIYTAASGTLLNIGVTLSSLGNQPIANGSFIGAGE